jgi:hypothetical protein
MSIKGFVTGNCNNNDFAHTKTGECSMFEGTPLGIIVTDKGQSFPIDEAGFNSAIRSGITAPYPGRITPILENIEAMAPNGGDLRTSTVGFGSEKPIGWNGYREDYTITAGGSCLHKQLQKLFGKTVRVIKVDQNQVAYGTVFEEGGEDKMRGLLATIGVAKTPNTGEATATIVLSVFYGSNYRNEEINNQSVALTSLPEGLTGVVLKKTSTGKAKVVAACSGEDLTDVFMTDLGVATIYKNSAGANPTGVSYANGELSFTPSGKYRIADAATLIAAGIEGVEGEDVYTDLA